MSASNIHLRFGISKSKRLVEGIKGFKYGSCCQDTLKCEMCSLNVSFRILSLSVYES